MIWILIKIAVIYQITNLICYFLCLLFSAKDKKFTKKNICLLIAHPDDECMFFGPILRLISKQNNKIFILCMTNGNYYGKGTERQQELKQSCSNLIGTHSLEIINEPSLPDDQKIEWNSQLCSKIISDYLSLNNIDQLITFDQNGVSSHLNHCYLNKIVKLLDKKPEIYCLKTIFMLRKYTFLFDLLPSLVYNHFIKQNVIAVNTPIDYLVTFKSMMKHKTQLMWFRWIYIVTSSYMFINNLEKQ